MRLITDVLREIRRGRPVEEASKALADVVRAVDETGKDGEVSITIKVKPSKFAGSSEKTLLCEIRAKRPIANIPEAIFFSNSEGDLLRDDPQQSEMQFELAQAKDTA